MRSKKQRIALLSASVLALGMVVVGCTGSDDDPTYGDYGGEVQVLHLFNGTTTEVVRGTAYFYSDYSPNPGEDPYGSLPTDTCVLLSQLVGGTTGTAVEQDVGTAVRIIGPGSPVSFPQIATGYYGTLAASPTDLPTGSTADVEWDVPATTLGGAINIPIEVTFTAPDPTAIGIVIPTSGDLSFSWTTHGGNTSLITFLPSSLGDGAYCKVTDDGSFAVPQSILSVLATDGTAVFLGGDVGFENAIVGTAGLEKSVHTIGFVGRAWFY